MNAPNTRKALLQTEGPYQYVSRAHALVLGLGGGLMLSSCVAIPSKEHYDVDNNQEQMLAQVEAIQFELAVHRTVWRDLYAQVQALKGLQGAERCQAEDNITRVIALMAPESHGAVAVNF